MTQVFELWDTETANLVGDYDTEEEALAVVRRVALLHGAAAVASFALRRADEDGTTVVVATGNRLTDRAVARNPAATSV